VAEDNLTPAERTARGSHVGCIAGALSKREYVAGLAEAGFADVSVQFTHPVADNMHAAIVRARKSKKRARKSLPVVATSARAGCC
jgi:hypothetical protein